ncbi:hypothetical protein [Spirillospora sp. CA-294931]|uniref:hypothetical protein n=1 Tax=Spirillospora sp. CA-294931 TaxID=3240042 RepID=UPI003D8FC5F0
MASEYCGPRRPLDPVSDVVEISDTTPQQAGEVSRLLAQQYADGVLYEFQIPHGGIYDKAKDAWSFQAAGMFDGAVLLGAAPASERHSSVAVWWPSEAHERLMCRPEFRGLAKKLGMN